MNDNILLVDDDPGAIQTIGRILSGIGQLRFATNGEDALLLARESVPDLILLDAEMPSMSGFQVCEALKAEPLLANVPVIFVTSHSEADFELTAFEMGAADFIAKPLSPAIVLARVKTQLRLKHIADELRRTAAHLKAVIDASPSAVICVDPQLRVMMWSRSAERMFGYTAVETVGNSHPLIPDDEREQFTSRFDRAIDGEILQDVRARRRRKDGTILETSYSAAAFRDSTGKMLGIVYACEDVTERIRQGAALARHVEALERSNQELDDFAQIVSHDLREPLRGLLNNSKFLREDYADKLDPEGVKRLLRLGDLCRRMDGVVNDLLYFSRLGRQELAVQPTDLNAIIHDIEIMSETTLNERNAAIVIPRSLPHILCDKTRITEVFRNLIINAVKYNENATKRIEVGYLDEVKTKEGVERRVFYVKDNGIGIAEVSYEDIFRIFRRLNAEDDDKQGTGVGLTFVRKIVERHGGRIWLDSLPGVGTTFYFTIEHGPAYEAAI